MEKQSDKHTVEGGKPHHLPRSASSCPIVWDIGYGTGTPLLYVVIPTFDYVLPKLVSLFLTDTGGHNPSYMYRLIVDYYSGDDLVLQRKAAPVN